MHVGILCFGSCVLIVFSTLIALENKGRYDHGYDEGWADCEDIHNKFQMSPDDDAVLKVLKESIKDYAKKTDAYERGDIKAIDSMKDFGELKHGVWEIFIYRKGV